LPSPRVRPTEPSADAPRAIPYSRCQTAQSSSFPPRVPALGLNHAHNVVYILTEVNTYLHPVVKQT
jgi:hypothetical protein